MEQPQSITQDPYNEVRKWRRYANSALLASAVLVLCIELYKYLPECWHIVPPCLHEPVRYIQVLLIIAYHALLISASIMHYQAGKKHFPDFLDNAFGTSLTSEHSTNYYADPSLKKGAYSLSLHTAENCYCTMKTFKLMWKESVKKAIYIVIISCIFLLTDHSNYFILLCKLTVPLVWLKSAVVYLYARHEFERLYKDIYKVMTHRYTQSELMVESIHILLQYETLKAWLNYPSSEKVFLTHRDDINKGFAKERKNYVISKEKDEMQ